MCLYICVDMCGMCICMWLSPTMCLAVSVDGYVYLSVCSATGLCVVCCVYTCVARCLCVVCLCPAVCLAV